MSEQQLATEYYLLWQVADAMNRMLLDAGVDFCGGACGGTCPLCAARKRFAPRKQPRIVKSTAVEV